VSNIAVVCAGTGLAGVRPQQVGLPDGPPARALDPHLPAEELLDAVRLLAEEHCSLVVLHDVRDRTGRQALLAVRALTEAEMLVVPVALPQLGLVVTAATLSALLPDEPAATLLAELIPQVAARLHVLARVSSVAGLREPSPRLTQHARSLLPGGAFLVTLQPAAAVTHWDARQGQQLAPIPAGCVAVLRGDEDAAVRNRILVSWPRTPVVELAPSATAASWFGARKVTEVVVAPLDLGPLRSAVGAPAALCRWCHQPARGSVCFGCSMLRTEDLGRPA
jgi:hypothetical protein